MLRRYINVFGYLFSDLDVVAYNRDGTENRRTRVPMEYGPKEKFVYRLKQDSNNRKPISKLLPRLTYEFKDAKYDPTRRVSHLRKICADYGGGGSRSFSYAPVPYNIFFDLYAAVKHQDDGFQIFEQIVPFFGPDFAVKIKAVPDLDDLTIDVPINLLDHSHEDIWDGSFEERRSIIWTFSFMMKGWFFMPINTPGVILQQETNYIDLTDTDLNYLNIVETP